jgi:cytochrome c biogenesis protein CcmG/thiol:disulfide interchange protein DsbE
VAATCGGSGPDSADPVDQGPAAQNATTAALLPTHVAELPTFDVGTYERLLTQLRGTPVVVNVWAAWCGPCKAEAPLLRAASQTYGDRVQFLGVDILDSLDGGRGFIAEHGLTYPSVFDPSGAIRDSLGMIGQPVTVFYDASGNMETYQGQLNQEALNQGIQAALG